MLPIQLNKDWLKKYWSLLMILVLFHLVVGVVVAANFPQKEFLMGWDSLHPEFNFLLNFKRSLTAVWQDNYGLGALVGHGFASLLPHNIITFFLFFFLPRWAIRAAFVLMMYWLGGLGALLVSRKILHKLFSDKSSVANLIPWLSLTAGGFYLLNLATVQQFYLPLEAFVVHFAFLPWFFLLIEDYLEKPSIKKLFWFGLVSFFGSIQGFIPIVFVALSMISGFFSLLWIGLSKNKKVEFNRWLRLGLVFVLVNAYWVLPVGYYTQANSGDFLSSYNNQLSTPKFLAKSQANGYLPDVAFLKSFLLEGEQPSGLVFEPWLNHLAQTHVEVIGWVLFGLISLGWIYLISSKKFKQHKSYAFSGLIAFGFLAPQVPPFKWVMNFIFNQSDLLAQTFRTAFTKFGLLMAFFYSLFLVFGLVFMVQLIKRILKFDFFQYLLIFAVMIGLMLFGWPVMQGKLFDHQLITAIPDSYFKVMDYFNNQEQGRVVELPVECAKGWYTRPWGYYGSGYMWFGIKQPYLSRTFDVWSQANENFFFEARYALRQPDYQGLDQVLDKYQVRWIFLDPNLEHCKSDKGLLYQKQLDEFLNQDQNYELKEIFSDLALEQPLKIYERTGAENKEVFSHDYVSVLSQPGSISKDWLYHQQTAYIETDAGQIDYPFAEFEAQNQDKQDQMVTIDKEFITLDTELSLDGKLIWPEYSNLEKKLPIIVELEESSEFAFYQIMIKIQGPRLRVNQQTKIEPIVIRAGTTSVENIENLNLFINEQRLTRLSPTEFLGSLSFGITNQLVAYQAGNRNIWWVWSEDQGSLDSYLSQKTVDLKQNDTVTLEIPKIFDQHQFGGYLLAKDMPLPFDCSPKKSEWAKFELG
ncbi:MAG: hypothetical protein U9O78_05105, partial [Patescibacteria group bacterium]|nr:hypothetical protein [Patescibacteria group bacterium]